MKVKEIPDFSGYYVSDKGDIYTTLKQGCRDRHDLNDRVVPRALTPRITSQGYARVYMRRDSTNEREDVYVHRLVAEMFLPNPDELPDVNHKNCDRLDNRVSNLEWMSHKDNLDYAFTDGNMTRNEKGQFTPKDEVDEKEKE